jgi:hypothetical protein
MIEKSNSNNNDITPAYFRDDLEIQEAEEAAERTVDQKERVTIERMAEDVEVIAINSKSISKTHSLKSVHNVEIQKSL